MESQLLEGAGVEDSTKDVIAGYQGQVDELRAKLHQTTTELESIRLDLDNLSTQKSQVEQDLLSAV